MINIVLLQLKTVVLEWYFVVNQSLVEDGSLRVCGQDEEVSVLILILLAANEIINNYKNKNKEYASKRNKGTREYL